MTTYKIFSESEYESFLKNKFSNNYGISEESIANWFMSQRGSYAVRYSYGVTKENLLSTYIPKLKELLGGYVFFLMYTVTEGGGAGNWINHYMSDTGSTGLQCLIDDCNYLLEVNNKYNGYPIAMTAPEVSGQPPQENINQGQNVYNSVGRDTIGAVMMPSTMAGNAWVFAEKWCLQNQGSYAPYVYFGNPYNQMIQGIQELGGNPFTPESSQSDSKPSTKIPTVDNKQSIELFIKEFGNLLGKIKQQFNNNLSGVGNDTIYNNDILRAEKVYNDSLIKVEISQEFLDTLLGEFKSLASKYMTTQPNTTDNKTTNGDGSGTPSQSNNLSQKVNNAIADIRGKVGGTVGDGQCYALAGYYAWLIDGGDISYSNGHNMRKLIGDGLNAWAISTGWDWTGWTIIQQPEAKDLVLGAIYTVAANWGGIWGTGQYGHVGIITGLDDVNVETTDQNYLSQLNVQIRQYDRVTFANGVNALIVPPK